MSKRLMEEVKEKHIPTTGEITEEMVDACMEEYWLRSEDMRIELEKALSPDQPKELNRCWICGIDDGDHDNWGFDYDYDTFVHITCLKEWGVENIQQYEQKRWEEYDAKKDETRRLPDDIGEPEENRFKLEIRKYDGMHAFGGYATGSAKEGKAIILIDGEMLFKEGELLADGEPYDPPDSERRAILIETLMHEFGHAIEDLLDRETDEDFIEKCVESYRSTSKTEG